MKKVEITIRHEGRTGIPDFFFIGYLHVARSIEELCLDEKSFYRKLGNDFLPTLPHYEIELDLDASGPAQSRPNAPKLPPDLYSLQIAISDKLQAPFVYWIPSINREEDALKIFRFWAVGTVYQITGGENFRRIFGATGSPEAFLRFMADTNKITVLGEVVSEIPPEKISVEV